MSLRESSAAPAAIAAPVHSPVCFASEPSLRDVATARRVEAFGGVDVVHATYVRHSFPPHFHETFAIGVMTRGTCALACRGSTFILRAGHIVAIAPGEVHTGQQVGDGGWSYRVMYPNRDIVAAAFPDAGPLLGLGFDSPVFEDPMLAGAIGNVCVTLERSDCPLEQESALLQVLTPLVQRHGLQPHNRPTRRHVPGATAARDYLHAHCTEPVTLTTLAGVAGLSCFYFIRVFRSMFGVTPHAYLAMLRLERARQLLRTSSSIAQVAAAVGFSDQSHLTRFFRRVYGMTPGVYAKAVRP
jgi:AraC-like DNA-binding protein/quercetin dioxygenase-like cupin family protein